MYEKFTDPTPHSFVTFSSTTKLGLGLPNKAMNNVRVSQNRTRQKKKGVLVFFVGFSSSIVRFIVSSFGENKPGNRVVVSSVGCFVVQLRNIFKPGMTDQNGKCIQ